MHKIELLQSRITQAHRYYDRVSAEVDRCEVREFDIEVSGSFAFADAKYD